MKESMIKLGKYLLSINAAFRKTKAGTGFITNNISAVQTNSDKIEKLAEQVGWTLLEMKPKYDKNSNSMSSHRYYLGLVKSNECTDAEDFVI